MQIARRQFISSKTISGIKKSLEAFYNPSRKNRVFKYLVAVVAVFLTLFFKLHWQDIAGSQAPFLMFFAAVTISALYGGIGPGMVATLLSASIVGYVFLPPYFEFSGDTKALQVLIFIIEGALISTVSELRKRAEMVSAALAVKEHDLVLKAESEINQRKKAEEDLVRSRNELAVILKEVDDGITVQDPKGNILFANSTAAKLTGFASADEMLKAPVNELIEKFDMFDESGANFPFEKLPGRVTLLTGKPASAIIRFRLKNRKRDHWSIVKATAIFDAKGKVQFAINVFQDITSQKTLDLKKDEFMTLVSHELRTPMTSLQGFTELLQKHLANTRDEKVTRYLSYMREEEARLARMVYDFLDVTRIRVGKLILNKESFRFDEFIRETVLAVQFVSTKHKILIKKNSKAWMIADRARLAQVVTNFLTNAMKYSPDANQIVVNVTKTKDEIQVSVQDFGIGISKEDQREIFSLFYQSDDPSRPSRGLGIGLYISLEIVKQHGGKIWIESEKGNGSTFYFSVPSTSKS